MTRPKKRPAKKPKRKARPARRELKLEELQAIVERTESGPLAAEDRETLKAAVETLAFVTQELERKQVSIQRLRKLLFGPSTEKTSQVVGEVCASPGAADEAAGPPGRGGAEKPKKKRKGHGRNSAAAYRGAEKVKIAHESLRGGERCPKCGQGKVYVQAQPAVLVRVVGMAPLRATVYERERLRCNLCGEVFTAREPPGVGEAKYDETAAAMIGLLKYGCGLPFNRLERLQRGMGIPLPAATQWETVERAAEALTPAYAELVRQAAQGEILHNDDTTMQILELTGKRRRRAIEEGQVEPDQRTGIFTSGIVSADAGRLIALFFTGRKHAGENLARVLAARAAELEAPIQMCDALSHNTAGDFETILASCTSHARRRFVDVATSFPQECRHVLETLREVYRNDSAARERGMSPEERLRLHQSQSGPLMETLKEWLEEQFEQRKVEPNSPLGDAIDYMLKYWHELTLFLREPGAPLDNNICERALKKAILHRKNALFYKTENGARVGDLFMSLIHTAELCDADPFDYLVALQRHHQRVQLDPAAWVPWNFQETLALLDVDPAPAR
ncbi:MAG: IS66 family transposase [Candidatus Krumholzibacteriia bacterium]